MFHIFHLLQCDMVLGIVNPLSWTFDATSNEKSCLIFNTFPVNLHWRTVNFFPSAASWLVNLNFPRSSRIQAMKTVENWAERGELDNFYKSHGYQASTWRTNTPNLTSNNRIYFVMYGGPRRPNFSPFQGRSRAPSWNFRPRFESPGFPSPGHNVYPPLGQPFQPSQRPYGFMDNPGPQGVRPGFQPGAWQVAGPRKGFRTGGYAEQQRPQRVTAHSICLH